MERPVQYNCCNEPPYPDHETVVFSIRYPDVTSHRATERCKIEWPHLIQECREFEEG